MVASRLLLILVACYGNEMLFVMEFCTEGVHTPNITLDASFPTNTLLPQGKEQHIKLGEWVREEYSGILDDNYAYFHFSTYPTAMHIASLKAQLWGIFNTTNYDKDISYFNSALEKCPRIDLLMQREAMTKDQHNNLMQDLEPYKSKIASYLQKPDVDIKDYFELGEAIKIAVDQKQILPSSIPSESHNLLLDFHEHYQEYLATGHREQVKLLSYWGLTQMIEETVNAMKKEKRKSRTKFCIHMVNEITFIAILKMMNIYTSHPPLASSLFVEFYKRYNEYYISMKYNGDPLILPTGGTEMTFKRFKKMITNRRFSSQEEWTQTCQSVDEISKSHFYLKYFMSLILFVLITCVILLLYRGYAAYKDKQKEE